jgi:hypothetical protein
VLDVAGTLDHPAALPLYLKLGFVKFSEEIKMEPVRLGVFFFYRKAFLALPIAYRSSSMRVDTALVYPLYEKARFIVKAAPTLVNTRAQRVFGNSDGWMVSC